MGERRPSDVFLGCLCVISGRAGLCHVQRWKRVGLESVLLQLAGSGLWPPTLLAILPSVDSGGWESSSVHTAELMGMISALCHAAPGHWNLFVADRSAKSAQNGQLRKVRFFVSDVSALDSVFCPEKQANSIPPSLSPFVTASSPLSFGPKKCAKETRFPSFGGLRSSQGFPRRDSQPRTLLVTRQPAEVSACDTSACRTCHRLCHRSVFGAKSAQNSQLRKVFSCQTASGMPEPLVSLVFGRKQAPDAHFAQDSAFSPENR